MNDDAYDKALRTVLAHAGSRRRSFLRALFAGSAAAALAPEMVTYVLAQDGSQSRKGDGSKDKDDKGKGDGGGTGDSRGNAKGKGKKKGGDTNYDTGDDSGHRDEPGSGGTTPSAK